jgi:hypothetical protein
MRDERSVIRGYTIFCDDIRHEVSGKVTYVGVYNGVIAPENGELPIVLPKLCVSTTINWYEDELPAPPMTLKIFGPGSDEALSQVEFQFPDSADVIWLPGEKSKDAFISISLQAAFTGITFRKQGALKVRAYGGGQEFKLGSLMVVDKMPSRDPD